MSDRLFHILIKPDAFIRGIVIDVITYLHKFYNVKIYTANIIEPNNKLLDIMYNDFKWEYDYFDHNRQLYKFGPSLSLVCTMDHDVSFKDIKGHTLPINNIGNNSVRSKFGVVDRSINIIHIADDFEGSHKEVSQIYCSDRTNCNELSEMSVDQIQTVIQQSRVLSEYLGVLSKIEQRMLTLLNSVNKLNSGTDSEINIVVNSMPKQFILLYESYNRIEWRMQSSDLGDKLKLLSFFHKCARNCNLYISQFELYVLYSQAYYYDVNGSVSGS